MEQFSKTVFGVVIVLCCLQVSTRSINNKWFQLLKTSVNCTLDSSSSASNPTFYAPPETVQDHCITTALDCIKRELHVTVRNECEDMDKAEGTKDKRINQAHDSLVRAIRGLKEHQPLTNSIECACESWPQVSFSQFVDKVEEFIQYINSK